MPSRAFVDLDRKMTNKLQFISVVIMPSRAFVDLDETFLAGMTAFSSMVIMPSRAFVDLDEKAMNFRFDSVTTS